MASAATAADHALRQLGAERAAINTHYGDHTNWPTAFRRSAHVTPSSFWHTHGQGANRVAATTAEIDAEVDYLVGLGDGVLTTITLADGPGLMYVGVRR